MRRTLALAAAALVAPFGGSAHAAGCDATALPALYEYPTSHIRGRGSFRCDAAAPGMTVTVCVEEGHSATAETWYLLGCETVTAAEPATRVAAEVTVGVPISFVWLRTTTTGANATGATATAVSAPVPWFNCACVIA